MKNERKRKVLSGQVIEKLPNSWHLFEPGVEDCQTI